jgi:AcrR family transcriptional regulator
MSERTRASLDLAAKLHEGDGMDRGGNDDTPISRTRILAAARKSFESAGYRRTGIAQIAREAGIAVGTVYRHFESKEDLLVAVLREINEHWLEKAREISKAPGTALERIMRLAEASVAYSRESRLLNAIWTRDTDVILAPLLDDLHAWVSKQNLALVSEIISDGVGEGTLRDLDPDKAAYILFLLGRSTFDQRVYPYSELVPTMIDIMLNGIEKND